MIQSEYLLQSRGVANQLLELYLKLVGTVNVLGRTADLLLSYRLHFSFIFYQSVSEVLLFAERMV